jgi:hypothetical protein
VRQGRSSPESLLAAVRVRADPAAPVVFALAPDASILVRAAVKDFYEVTVGEFAEGATPAYFVPRASLEPAGP